MAIPTAASAESMTYRSAKSGAQASASDFMRSQAPSLASAGLAVAKHDGRHPAHAIVGADERPRVAGAGAVAVGQRAWGHAI